MKTSKYIWKWVDGEYKRRDDKSGMSYKRGELVREPLTRILTHPDHMDLVHPSETPFRLPFSRVRIE